MTTASPRADNLMISYDLAQSGHDYTAVVVLKRNEDGSLELLHRRTAPGESVSRGDLLVFCFGQICERQPRTVWVRVGQSEPILINQRTIEEILDGRKTAQDLLIGS